MKTFALKSRLLIPASILALGTITSATVQAQEDALNIGAVPTGTGWFLVFQKVLGLLVLIRLTKLPYARRAAHVKMLSA